MKRTQYNLFLDYTDIYILFLCALISIFLYIPLGAVSINYFHNDDVRLINELSSISHTNDILHYVLSTEFFKFRPISNLNWLIEYYIFGFNYKLYIYYNVLLNIIVCALLIRLFNIKSQFIKFFTATIYLSSKYILYSIWNITGSFETLSLIFFILILHNIIKRNVLSVCIFSVILILTSEKYLPFIVLTPIIMTVVAPPKERHAKPILVSLIIIILYALIRINLNVPIFIGTQTDNLLESFNFFRLISFVVQSLGHIFGISYGPTYLTGFDFRNLFQTGVLQSSGVNLLILTVSLSLLILIITVILTLRKNIDNNIILFYISGLIMIIPASITFRLELRWLAPSFVSFLLGLMTSIDKHFLFKRNDFKTKIIISTLIMFICCNLLFALHLRPQLYFSEHFSKKTIIR